jgi:inner membrane protein
MDSITQIVLGAAVGEAVLGKKIGNQALFWGAVAGTIPDLDVLANPFQDIVEQLSWHRSLTHSVFFALATAPLFAWAVLQIKSYKAKTTLLDWSQLFFWCFFTHALLDACTTWGTQLLYPFSNYGFSTNTVFVIDPLYTLPFLFFLIQAARTPYQIGGNYNPKRKKYNYLGLGISTAYLVLGFVLKWLVLGIFTQSLTAQNIPFQRLDCKVTALNIVLWNAVAETQDGFYSGYYSLFDRNNDIAFNYFPKNSDLLKPYQSHPKVQTLQRITEGFYTLQKHPTNPHILQMNDLRFGQIGDWQGGKGEFVFVYFIENQTPDSSSATLAFSQKPNKYADAFALLGSLWERIKGRN